MVEKGGEGGRQGGRRKMIRPVHDQQTDFSKVLQTTPATPAHSEGRT